MFGVIYSAASDFSIFSHPRAPYSSGICHDDHSTLIELRYCPKQHLLHCTDKEWDELLAQGIQLFDDSNSESQSEATHYNDSDCESKECTPPPMSVSVLSTPSLVGGNCMDDFSASDSELETESSEHEQSLSYPASPVQTSGSMPSTPTAERKRKHGKANKAKSSRKRLCRASSTASISTLTSIESTSSALNSNIVLPSECTSGNPWKCPHCPWIQHTRRLPDFLRHQRSHFVSQSDWPCPNPKCGKGFARKDSLKRHLDNRSTGCTRPPGYTVC